MKKKTKKNIRIIAVVIVVLIAAAFIGRGCIHRTVISYKEAGSRKTYKVKDKNLASYIEANIPAAQDKDIESVIDLSLEITDKALDFSTGVKESDPNKLVLLGVANREGYAAFTAATGNYLIGKYGLSQVWEAKPVKGRFYLFGVDMRAKTKSDMFRDHDFVIFRNKATKREITVDPVTYQSWGIDRISKY